MSNESEYAAFRAYADVYIKLTVREAQRPLEDEIRSLRTQLETRAVEKIEGPPGKDGTNGKDGADGKDGAPGERGTNGIGTLEDLKVAAQEVFADYQVRTFADIYQGVYKPDQLYNRGLITTWGGSLWLSLAPTTKKPGEGPDWRLVVKK